MNLGLAVNKKSMNLIKFSNLVINYNVMQCNVAYSNYQCGMVKIFKFPYVKYELGYREIHG